jgi:diadenosine tetraphosphatase ApaH/serine/threonine PP2A family protein phosphatase
MDVDFVCVGHTHIQYALKVDKTIVINPGSVGLPRDGDPRAAYAIMSQAGIELKRVEYPIDETLAAVEATEMPENAKTLLAEALRTGRLEKKNGNGNGAAAERNGVAREGVPVGL